MAGEGVGGLLVPDDPLVCPTGTSVVEAYAPCLCPKLPKGSLELFSWRLSRQERRALSMGKGLQHPQPAIQDLKTVN